MPEEPTGRRADRRPTQHAEDPDDGIDPPAAEERLTAQSARDTRAVTGEREDLASEGLTSNTCSVYGRHQKQNKRSHPVCPRVDDNAAEGAATMAMIRVAPVKVQVRTDWVQRHAARDHLGRGDACR